MKSDIISKIIDIINTESDNFIECVNTLLDNNSNAKKHIIITIKGLNKNIKKSIEKEFNMKIPDNK